MSVPRKYYGFTLIETLVVVVIVSVVLTIAVMAVGSFNSARQVKRTAQQFKHAIELAKVRAILMPQTLSLEINKKGYYFFSYKHDKENEKKLHKVDEGELSQAFANGISGSFISLQQNKRKPKEVLFTPSGDVTPFSAKVEDSKRKVLFCLKVDAAGFVVVTNCNVEKK